jgi:lysophospholipase L1-like esterase
MRHMRRDQRLLVSEEDGAFRSILRIVAVNLGLLLAVALVVELVFGGWFSKSGLDQLNILRGTEQHFSAKGLYPGGDKVVYKKDTYGFRGWYSTPSQIDILTIGGSTTNQIYLTEGQTWQDKLAGLLSQEGKRVSVVNAGVDGQTTVGHLRSFELWFPYVPNLRPRFVLAYVGLNDVGLESPANSDMLNTYPTLMHKVRRKSAIWRFSNTALGMLQAYKTRVRHDKVDFATVQWTDKPLLGDYPNRYAKRIEAYGERLEELIRRIRSIGATPILMTQRWASYRVREGKLEGMTFKPGEPNGVDTALAIGLFNAKTLEVCRAQGAICLDLAGEVDFTTEDFYDTLHNTPKGAERIAIWLHGKLKETIRP